MRDSTALLVCVALALGTRASYAQRAFGRIDIDSTDQLRIILSDGRAISPARDSDQVVFEQTALSPDRRIAGWVASYPNCCTTYPIPLTLVLLRPDGTHTVIKSELPIWQWAFAPAVKSVIIRLAPIHGPGPTLFERRDIRTGRVIASVVLDSASRQPPPAWARGVIFNRGGHPHNSVT